MFPVADTAPRRQPPLVVWVLVTANSVIFLLEVMLPPELLEWVSEHFALIPARYTDPVWASARGLDSRNWLPFLTNMFLHGGWLHLVANMWTLWLFGSAVEDRLGPVRFLVFYLLSGLLASITHFATNLDSTLPALGASGAIAGVMGAYALLFPLARIIFVVPVLFFPFFFDLPALLYMGMWFLLQFLQGTWELLMPRIGGGVAWWAHVGGFVAGLVLVRAFAPRGSVGRPYAPDEGRLGYGVRGEPV